MAYRDLREWLKALEEAEELKEKVRKARCNSKGRLIISIGKKGGIVQWDIGI